MENTKNVSMKYYIDETPSVVLHNIENRQNLTNSLVNEYINGCYDGLTIVTCGSSYNGCLAAKYFIRKYLKSDVKLVNPFTFMYHENDLRQNTMTVFVSQSGCSTNIVDCAKFEKAKGGRIISLTGRNDCDLKPMSDVFSTWGVGEEIIGYVTKGVVSLAAYWMLFSLEVAKRKETISKEEYENELNEMKKAMKIHPEIVKATIDKFNDNTDLIIGCNRLYAISSGPNLATAIEGSLKIAETSCITCVGLEVEEYLHGPIYPVDPDTLLLFIDNNDDPSSKRIIEVAKGNEIITDRLLAITNDANIDDKKAIRTSEETSALISPLYKLASVETLAYLRTEKTNNYKPHPNVVEYERRTRGETKTRNDLIIDLQGL